MRYLIAWALASLLYAPVFYQLYSFRWRIIDYTHAYFILPIALWLAWRRRAELKTASKNTDSRGGGPALFLLVCGLIMFTFGWRQDYLFISTCSLIPVLFGMAGYLHGIKTAKTLTLPILYLLLLVPLPAGVIDSVTLPMRHGTSVVAAAVLKILRYPIAREGLLLFIGSHEIFMGAPCSGLRSLITMFSLALPYVLINNTTPAKKLILIAVIIPLALLGNLLRVIALCLVTYHFGEAVGQGFFHNFSGIVIFVILIAGLLATESLLNRRLIKTKNPVWWGPSG